MATGAPTLERPTTTYVPALPGPKSDDADIDVLPLGASQDRLMWHQVDSILRRSLGPALARDRLSSAKKDGSGSVHKPELRIIAPGIAISVEEYERRFSGIYLDELRSRMPAQIFEAFVRHLGAIPGNSNLDVVAISSVPNR
jgi:hypothetical protein